eukprot:CAMPEP_0172490278 /NCGR_PEP_ID=MMETSP1066-20121228/20646_1 /TAXON_ID=671091 /ORGANISM="Coscinodiscus wailesii, Strain CCMP2513" /LENGTH=173 /DNA_ID=CAMNT_0013258663 /DNA_START=56 /DNA_END=574 /DNA_ORIENTATION=-
MISILIDAIQLHNFDEARIILKSKEKRIFTEATDENGMNALHYLCNSLYPAPIDVMASMLTASGQAPLQKDDGGRTPIHYAMHNPNISDDCRIMLIKTCPLSVSIRDNFNDLPTENAIEGTSSSEVIQQLIIATGDDIRNGVSDATCFVYSFLEDWARGLEEALSDYKYYGVN